MQQTLYNGVKFPVSGPDLDNVERIDLPALNIIHRMMKTGMQVDPSHFAKMSQLLRDDMDRITEEIKTKTGYYINPGSGDQVADLLFKKLGIKQARAKMTKTGKRESVEDAVLTAIQHEHPVIGLLQDYKEYEKLDGTYARPLQKMARRIGPDNWRIFQNLKHTRVPSGRYACEEPNLLAMPNRTDRARQLLEGFITKPGWCYLSVDESQIEPRVAAHSSEDEGLMHIYHTDQDIYSDFATKAFRLKDERWECQGYGKDKRCDNNEHIGHGWHYPTVHKKKQRFPAKTCILAWIYDVSGMGLLEQMPIVCKNCDKEASKHDCNKFESLWTENNCQDLINAAGMTYPGVIRDRVKFHSHARKYAYVVDMWGRILHVAAVRSVLQWVVSAALREVGNFPYQAGAQGTIKLTQAKVDDDFEEMGIYGDVVNPLLQIHDELLFECREDMADEVGGYVADCFEKCVKLRVPIKASMAKAKVWGLLPK